MDAFWKKVAIGPKDQCWIWTGARNRKGYGNFRSRSAHVVSYEIAKSKVPEGLEVDHLCRNRSCVNPWHLEAVTRQENVRRAQPTHCKNGHELAGPNIRIVRRPDGVRRKCLKCHTIYEKKARENGRR